MKLAAFVIAAFALWPSCKKADKLDVSAIKMHKLVRAPLQVEVPDWPIGEDARAAAVGKHKVQKGNEAFVEVSWQGGEPLTADELQDLGRSVTDGFKINRVDDKLENKTDEIHYQLIGTIGSPKQRVWMAMEMVQCTKTNVTVTIGIGTRSEASTRALHDKVASTFRCVGDSPDKFQVASVVPSTNLPDEFGYALLESNHILASADGRLIFVLMSGGDISSMFSKHPRKAMDTFGKLLGVSITNVSKPRRITGMAGLKMDAVTGVTADGPLAAAAFYCRDTRTTFMLLASKDKGVDGDLVGLLSRFGCPGSGGAPLNKRKSACEVGVDAFCKTEPAAGDAAP